MAKKEVIKLTTPPFVAAFTDAIFEAKAVKTSDGKKGEPKFSVTAIWTPAEFTETGKKYWAGLGKAIDEACKAKFGKGWKECKASVDDGGIEGFKPGIRSGKSKGDMAGFGDGKQFANLTSQYQPDVVDHNGKTITKEDGVIYSGCLMRATVNVYAYDNVSKGVSIGLFSLQLLNSNQKLYPKLVSRGSGADDFADADIDKSWLDQDEEAVGAGSKDDDIPF